MEWNLVAVLLLIAIVVPPPKNMGVNGFMKNFDYHIEKPAKRLTPPKFIQFRYGIEKSNINIITYLSFLVDFADWLMCIALLPCVLILKDEFYDTAGVIFAIIYICINLPIGIARTVCSQKIAKKQKVKLNSEEYVAMRSLAETFASSLSTKKEQREYEKYVSNIHPFLKEFEKCLSKNKGIKYISNDNLKYAINKIFPKYEKHLYYIISNGEYENKFLSVHLVENDKILIQIQIKKA